MSTQHAPQLIGLIGAAGAGKSTVAGYLEDRWSWQQIAFADPIVDMISALFDAAGVASAWMTERALKERPTPLLGLSYRRLAQTLGTEWGRDTLDPEFWVRIAEHRVRTWHAEGQDVVLSDVRHPEEAKLVLRLGGALVRINRPCTQPLHGAAGKHSSEQHYRYMVPMFELHNGHSFAALESQVDDLVQHLRTRPPLRELAACPKLWSPR